MSYGRFYVFLQFKSLNEIIINEKIILFSGDDLLCRIG